MPLSMFLLNLVFLVWEFGTVRLKKLLEYCLFMKTEIKVEDEKTVEELEKKLEDTLKQAAEGDTVSDTDEIRERVKQIQERS